MWCGGVVFWGGEVCCGGVGLCDDDACSGGGSVKGGIC